MAGWYSQKSITLLVVTVAETSVGTVLTNPLTKREIPKLLKKKRHWLSIIVLIYKKV